MKPSRILLATLGVAWASATIPATPSYPPKTCDGCEHWSQPGEPFHVFGNTWFVGPANLSSILIHGKEGAILIDGGLPQSAPVIIENIRKLGFRVEDVRIIVNSHAHYDHAGGIAQLQEASGARVYASAPSRRAFERGQPTAEDPQFAFGEEHNSFPAIREVRTVKDGQTLRVGSIAITAHFTPGHTPGGTTWTWRDCEGEGTLRRCLNLVYADSLGVASAPGFRFSGDAQRPSLAPSFQRSIDTVAALPCDLLLAPHPELIDLKGKLARRASDAPGNPFIDSNACREYARAARGRLDKRLAEERAAAETSPAN